MTKIKLTDGMWLRSLRGDDAQDITAAVREADVIRWTRVPAPYSAKDGVDFIRMVTAKDGEPDRTLAICVPDTAHEDGRLVGVVGLVVDERSETAELGYWIAREHRGQGFTSSAVKALIDHGFQTLGLARIWMVAAVDNPGSNAIAARLGFTREGTMRAAHRYRDVQGRTTGRGDLSLWGLLPDEWPPVEGSTV